MILGATDGEISLTNGAGITVQQVETTPGHNNKFVVNFPNGVQTTFEWQTVLPDNFVGTTVTPTIMWDTTDAGADTVDWGFQAVAVPATGSTDVAFGAAQEVSSTNAGANEENDATTAAVTIGGTPAAGNKVFFKLYRKATGTLASVARMMFVVLR